MDFYIEVHGSDERGLGMVKRVAPEGGRICVEREFYDAIALIYR